MPRHPVLDTPSRRLLDKTLRLRRDTRRYLKNVNVVAVFKQPVDQTAKRALQCDLDRYDTIIEYLKKRVRRTFPVASDGRRT